MLLTLPTSRKPRDSRPVGENASVQPQLLHQTRSRPNFQRAGCWNPRLKRFGAGGDISGHAWGIAIGINVDVNPFGARPVQGPRLVAIMEEHGFYWGGRFRRPDGTHFEWVT